MLKRELRKIYSEQRMLLNKNEWASASELIVQKFSELDLFGIQYLLSYYPIPERKEFNVGICEELLRLENNGLQVAWPKLDNDGFTMHAILKTEETILLKNKFNILEPQGTVVIDPQMIDAVFVPLLAFDVKGYRVGYGKGFYDRYLSRCAQDVVKIGFSYFDAVDIIDDIDEFDVPLNYCITPLRVYEF